MTEELQQQQQQEEQQQPQATDSASFVQAAAVAEQQQRSSSRGQQNLLASRRQLQQQQQQQEQQPQEEQQQQQATESAATARGAAAAAGNRICRKSAIALHDRWEGMVQDFNKQHSDSCCVFFDEVAALERLRLSFGAAVFDRSMWDFSMFHPTAWGHEQLAAEAHRLSTEQFPGLKDPAAASAASAAPKETKGGYAGASGSAGATGSTNETSEVKTNGDKKLKAHIRNVKGDVAFEVTCNANWKTSQLTQAVLEKAPSGFADSSCVCVFAMKGKFLSESETLEKMGVQDGVQLIAVVKPKSASR
eukprot:s223_g51.t1